MQCPLQDNHTGCLQKYIPTFPEVVFDNIKQVYVYKVTRFSSYYSDRSTVKKLFWLSDVPHAADKIFAWVHFKFYHNIFIPFWGLYPAEHLMNFISAVN